MSSLTTRHDEWIAHAGSLPPAPPAHRPVSEPEAWEYEHRHKAWELTRTPAQRAFIRAAALDPEWRAFHGFDPLPACDRARPGAAHDAPAAAPSARH